MAKHPEHRLTQTARMAWVQMRVHYEDQHVYPGNVTVEQVWDDMLRMPRHSAARLLRDAGSASAQATFKAAWRRIRETYTSRDREELMAEGRKG